MTFPKMSLKCLLNEQPPSKQNCHLRAALFTMKFNLQCVFSPKRFDTCNWNQFHYASKTIHGNVDNYLYNNVTPLKNGTLSVFINSLVTYRTVTNFAPIRKFVLQYVCKNHCLSKTAFKKRKKMYCKEPFFTQNQAPITYTEIYQTNSWITSFGFLTE